MRDGCHMSPDLLQTKIVDETVVVLRKKGSKSSELLLFRDFVFHRT